MRRIRRRWCKMFHRSIMFAGGATYTCRTCQEVFENPALDGPIRRLPLPVDPLNSGDRMLLHEHSEILRRML